MFTHQGAYWVDEMPQDFRIGYPGKIEDYRESAKATGLTRIQDYIDVPDSGFDPTYFEKRFANGVSVCKERDVAMYCGEYGVIDRADPKEILKWYKEINAAFKKFGIGRAAWNYKEKDDLFLILIEGIEGMEEFFLGTFLADDKLNIVNQQNIDVAVL